ncbi:ebrA repressor [Agromyces rhizosphaerae]|uniref:EbrA repressor n=1 Tax=Agromyces rhizosphaerae TaxID=88374 RepID=A0A9W6CWI2_9MICO|nr:TetR/AcrR family transcriptional regulator [Agromyces rhizosphaerae]GLI27852.1 ebrA repressor [Agromyces rhizosphaerae]
MRERMDAAERREQIADAALHLLATEGADALTAARLTEVAGISRGNLFHHFATIDDVVLAAFERSVATIGSVHDPRGGLREWLLAMGGDVAGFAEEQDAMIGATFAFLTRARSDPRLRARLEELLEATVSGFESALATRAADAADSRALATAIVIAADGVAMHRHVFPERHDEQLAAWRALVDRIAPEHPPAAPDPRS